MAISVNSSRISDLIGVPASKPILCVFVGFSPNELEPISNHKLFSFEYPSNLKQFQEGNPLVLTEVAQRISDSSKFYWCTIEEYLFHIQNTFEQYFDFRFIYNNFYYRHFPLYYEMDSIDEITYLFTNDDTNIPEHLESKFSFYTQFFSNIIEAGRHYVSYTLSDEIHSRLIPYHTKGLSSIPVLNKPDGEYHIIEMSEDERDFLKMTENLLQSGASHKYLLIETADIDTFPNEYRSRILLLQESKGEPRIYMTKREIEKSEADFSPYLDILKRYWGYPSFRDLKMYKNPDISKNLTTISQGQIIHDLAANGEAAYREEPFRDIFITSPTGAGKSVMFQIPALRLFEQHGLLSIVISPLIGLMKDQVENLKARGISSVATINSDITPMEKSEITDKVHSGEISTLYISPETLLSRSDIRTLIGERRIGLLIVDEAHIVTTWGKSFRADYWYMGTYLQKLRKEMKFPIATFTATAIYGGEEDMYKETRDSLALLHPITYLGEVKRDDLEIQLNSKESNTKGTEYMRTKFLITAERIKRFLKKDEKTLIYFPTVKMIRKFKEFMEENHPRAAGQIVVYYGPLTKEYKEANTLKFKNGEAKIMLATKAFGMGIDIPDIENVYHFAPTGNVCDYVQEIGRAARDEAMTGYAYFDFLSNDFSHVRRLHGMSVIRKSQLQMVVKKILSIYREKRSKTRNLLVNAEDFRYIFEDSRRPEQEDEIDSKLKTALLLLEKDFTTRMGYSPFVARPRGMFSKEYFYVNPEGERLLNLKKNEAFAKKIKSLNGHSSYSAVYELDLKKVWEKEYKNISFPKFKYLFYEQDDRINLSFAEHISPVMELSVTSRHTKRELLKKVHQLLDFLDEFLRGKAMDRSYFQPSDLGNYLQKQYGKDRFLCEGMAQIALQTLHRYGKLTSIGKNSIASFDERRGYAISPGYVDFFKFIRQRIDTSYLNGPSMDWDHNTNTGRMYIPRLTASQNEKVPLLFGFLEAFGLLSYQLSNGNSPEIYIRINSVLELERIANHPEKYRNRILETVHFRHKLSVAMLTYIFKNKLDTEAFWDLIEDYFLGKIPEQVLMEANRNKDETVPV